MFADDTTVYLDKSDSFEELQSILDRWCRASSAKFNVGKTEVIPVGSPAYRAFLLAYRRLNDLDGPIPDNIHIVREGESVRILGGHVGNGIDDFVMWTPIVEKVDAALARWDALHPTLEARCQIVQITIGSMTQYLTQVNEMPPQIVNHLLKSQREFMWGGKSSPVQRETLMAPRLQGGKKMLDLKSRNDALQLMKLKTYLHSDPETRATWCFLTDHRLQRITIDPTVFSAEALGNCFTQKWRPNERKWPKRHREMLRCAKKYGVSFDTENPSGEIQGQLPLWHHLGEDPDKRQTNNSPACRCLRENHGVLYVNEGMTMLRRLQDDAHRRTPNCKCPACQDDRRSRGCTNPHACTTAVEKKIASLLPKWAPDPARQITPDPGLEREEGTFVSPAPISSMTDGFRVFIPKPEEEINHTQGVVQPRVNTDNTGKLEIFVDSAARRNDEGVTTWGGGLWYGPNDPRNQSFRIAATQTQTALSAIASSCLAGARETPRDQELVIHTKSPTLRIAMTQRLQTMEDRGWIGIPDRESLRALAGELKARSARTIFRDGEADRAYNKSEASALAVIGARRPDSTQVNLETEPSTSLRGAKLSTLTQAMAYAGIRELKVSAARKATDNNVKQVQIATKANFNSL